MVIRYVLYCLKEKINKRAGVVNQDVKINDNDVENDGNKNKI